MADSFFEINNSLTGLGLDDAPNLDEEEYDALNNETFGDNEYQGDWEADHTKYAEVRESSRLYPSCYNSDNEDFEDLDDEDDDLDLETSLSQLVLEDCEDEGDVVLPQVAANNSRTIDPFDNFKTLSKQRFTSSSIWSTDSKKPDPSPKPAQQIPDPIPTNYSTVRFLPPQIPKIPTVQELERDLMQKNKQSKPVVKEVKADNVTLIVNQGRTIIQNVNQQVIPPQGSNTVAQNVMTKFTTFTSGTSKMPPGFSGLQRPTFLQPAQQEMLLIRNNVNMPMMLGPGLLPPYILPNPPPLLLPQNPRLVPPPPPPMMRFMPPHPVLLPQQQHPSQKNTQHPSQKHPQHMNQKQQQPPHPPQQQPHPQQLPHPNQQQLPHPNQQQLPAHHQQMRHHQQQSTQQQHHHHHHHQTQFQQHQTSQHLFHQSQILQPQQHPQQHHQIPQMAQQQQFQLLFQQHHILIQNTIQPRCNQIVIEGQKSSKTIKTMNHAQSCKNHIPDRRGAGDYDEYAGLMNIRERTWLRNIQLIQLTTDRPHMDDYYYNEWLKKQDPKVKKKTALKNGIKKDKIILANKTNRADGGNNKRKDNTDQDSASGASSKAYVPLQFENSLGKLQCVSVTAPRKLIDLDVVSEPQAEAAPVSVQRDSRKAKKLLLELERLYLMVMEIEEIDGNVRVEEKKSTKPELLGKIMSSFLNETRFLSFMCIRKGKALLLRIMKHLNVNEYHDQLFDLWTRTIKSIAVVVRRDHHDGILLQLYPYFKEWVNATTYSKLTVLTSSLLTGNTVSSTKSSSRAVSPVSAKTVLSVSLASKFGVSVIASILTRGEKVYPNLYENEQLEWSTFVLSFMKQMTNVPSFENIPTPLEPLSPEVVTSILNRSTGLQIQDYASAKRSLNCFQ